MSVWGDVTGAVSSAANNLINGAATIIHDGVQLTQEAIHGAGQLLTGGTAEARALLGLLGDPDTMRKVAGALESAAAQMEQAGNGFAQLGASTAAWHGAGGDAFRNATKARQNHFAVAANAFHGASSDMMAYAQLLDEAHATINHAISRLESASPLDVAAHPTIVTRVISSAHDAANHAAAMAGPIASHLSQLAASAPASTAPGAQGQSLLTHLDNAISNNVSTFLDNPLGYAWDFQTALQRGFLDGAKQFAVLAWISTKTGFELQFGTPAMKADALHNLGVQANSLWHMSNPYWLTRFATDPHGAQAEGAALLSQYFNWNQVEAGHANQVVGHLDGIIGFQVALAVATDGLATALTTSADATAVAADAGMAAKGLAPPFDQSASAALEPTAQTLPAAPPVDGLQLGANLPPNTAITGYHSAGAGGIATTSDGRQFLVLGDGRTAEIPTDWQPVLAKNSNGVVYQSPSDGATVRIMDPTTRYPEGYFRYTAPNSNAIDFAGKASGIKPLSHFPLTHPDPLLNFPGPVVSPVG